MFSDSILNMFFGDSRDEEAIKKWRKDYYESLSIMNFSIWVSEFEYSRSVENRVWVLQLFNKMSTRTGWLSFLWIQSGGMWKKSQHKKFWKLKLEKIGVKSNLISEQIISKLTLNILFILITHVLWKHYTNGSVQKIQPNLEKFISVDWWLRISARVCFISWCGKQNKSLFSP